jgi:Ca-activated chloride channel family protein
VTLLAGALAGVLAGSAPGAGSALQQPPVFRAGVDSVYVDVFVTRGGAPVLGLAASHFELRDNGRLERPELLAMESVPLTALLVFDTSDSMRGGRLDALRSAARDFLEGLRPLDEAGLIAFSHEVRWLARPTADKGVVSRALAQLRAKGATAAWDALSAAMTVLPATSRSLVVVFSDGEDTLSWLDAAQVRAQAARSNALVQVVGFSSAAESGDAAHIGELKRVAEITGGRFWLADSSARLGEAFRAIVEAMNTRYVLRYDPGPDAKPGHHRIEVRLKGAKGDVRARQGYWRAK